MVFADRWLRNKILFFCVLISIVACCSLASADTRYVSDVLVITLREGPGTEYKIIKTLKTDTAMEILAEEGRYFRVRTEDNKEGWVLKQYISHKTPKATIIARQTEELQQLKTRITELSQQVRDRDEKLTATELLLQSGQQEMREKFTATTEEYSRLRQEHQTLTDKYNALLDKSKHVLQLSRELDALRENHNVLQSELFILQDENSGLKRSKTLWWFLAGAGVLLTGYLAGKSAKRKKTYF